MIPSIAIIGRKTGEGNAAPVSRPSVCGKTHSEHAGRSDRFAIFGPDAFARVMGWLGFGSLKHRTVTPLDFSRHFLAPGSRVNSGLSSAVRQDLRRYRAKSFQDFILSARETGLAAGVVGQHTDRREMKCPTKALKESTK